MQEKPSLRRSYLIWIILKVEEILMKKITYLKIFCLIIWLLITCVNYAQATENNQFEKEQINPEIIERGRVLSIERTIVQPTDEYPFPGQILKVKVLSGKFQGQIQEVYNVYSNNPAYDIQVKANQKVILVIVEEDGQLIDVHLSDVSRDTPLLILGCLFAITLIILGGRKGITALTSLIFTVGIVFFVLLPLIIKGFNPMLITIILSGIITTVTLLLVSGWKRKTLAAIIGIIGGATCAGLLAYFFGRAANLTGFGSQEAQMLGFFQDYKLNFQGILFASMLFGALGAVMDVGMSIASAIEEVYNAHPLAKPQELFRAGMNVGRDIMGTMANTLILAYTGGSLPLLLILISYQSSFLKVINLDLIASEIIRALTGSLGLFIAIPLTAAVSTWLIYQETMKKYYN